MQDNKSNSENMRPEADVMPGKKKKPIFKKWWFWLLIVVVLIIIIGLAGGSGDKADPAQPDVQAATTANSAENAAATQNSAETAAVTQNSVTAAQAEKPQDVEGQIGRYIVTIKESRITTDYEGSPILLVTYSFTNNNDDPQSFMMAIDDKLYQNGVELGDVYTSYGIDGYNMDNASKSVQKGVTLDVQEAYKLNDTTTDVEVRLAELISFSDKYLTYTIDIG